MNKRSTKPPEAARRILVSIRVSWWIVFGLVLNAARLVDLTHQRSGPLRLDGASVIRMKIDDAPGDERRHGRATKGMAIKGRVATLGLRSRHVERPGTFGIQDRQVCSGAGA